MPNLSKKNPSGLINCILAGSFDQARDFIKKRRKKFRYIAQPEDLLGLRYIRLYRMGTWYYRSDLQEINDQLAAVSFCGKVVYKDV